MVEFNRSIIVNSQLVLTITIENSDLRDVIEVQRRSERT